MTEGLRRSEEQMVPLRTGIYEYVKKWGPVDMREIVVGGKSTGWISEGHTELLILESIHQQLDSGELIYTNQHQIIVANQDNSLDHPQMI